MPSNAEVTPKAHLNSAHMLRKSKRPGRFGCPNASGCLAGRQTDARHGATGLREWVVWIVGAAVCERVSKWYRGVGDDGRALLQARLPGAVPMPKVVPSAVSQMKALRVYPHNRIIPHIRIPVHPITERVLVNEAAELGPVEPRAELEEAGGDAGVAPGSVLVSLSARIFVDLQIATADLYEQRTYEVPAVRRRLAGKPAAVIGEHGKLPVGANGAFK